MVISGGVNIYPAEIEAAPPALPGVHDCAVFGIPHEEFGETLCAHIEPEPGVVLAETAIRSFLRERLPHFKVPRIIRFEANLPREDSGKIMKRKLRDPYWETTGRRIQARPARYAFSRLSVRCGQGASAGAFRTRPAGKPEPSWSARCRRTLTKPPIWSSR